MTSNKNIAAVVNPHSAGGRTGRQWTALAERLERLLGPVTARFTDAPGAGIALTRALLAEGFDFLIAVGGDGTINEAVNGFIEHDRNRRPEARLGILPMGTGGDFRRTLGVPTNIEEAVEVLRSGVSLPIDVGKATYQDYLGHLTTRYFVNVVSFGLGGEVASGTRNALSVLGGRAAFFWATLVSFAKYGGRSIRLRFDGIEQSYIVTNVAIGNGRFHGGGMHPCPTAVLNDGMLEVTVIDRLNAFELIRDIRILYSDNIYRHPKTHHLRTRKLSAEAQEVTKIEVDGEPLGTLPLQVSLVPDRLCVIVPTDSPLARASPEFSAGEGP